MTEEDAFKIADTPDWWMGADGPQAAMRPLRAALKAAAAQPRGAFLFRPGGFGAEAIWLSAADIERLNHALNAAAEEAA